MPRPSFRPKWAVAEPSAHCETPDRLQVVRLVGNAESLKVVEWARTAVRPYLPGGRPARPLPGPALRPATIGLSGEKP